MSASSSSVTQERWRNSISGTSGSSSPRTRASSASASGDFLTRGWYWSRTPRIFPDASSGAERLAEVAERRLEPGLAVARHLAARLDVEDEVLRRPLGPAGRRLRRRQVVERRVDLDHVEALRVVAQAGLGARHAAGVPVLHEPVVGPAAGADADSGRHPPSLQSADGLAAGGRVRLGDGRAHRAPRVPGDDAARGFRLPRRRSPAAVRAQAARRDPPLRARDRGLPRGAGREADRRCVQLGDFCRAARAAGAARRADRRRDHAGGARRRAGDAEPPGRADGDAGDGVEPPLRGARPRARRRRARLDRPVPSARAADRERRPVR